MRNFILVNNAKSVLFFTIWIVIFYASDIILRCELFRGWIPQLPDHFSSMEFRGFICVLVTLCFLSLSRISDRLHVPSSISHNETNSKTKTIVKESQAHILLAKMAERKTIETIFLLDSAKSKVQVLKYHLEEIPMFANIFNLHGVEAQQNEIETPLTEQELIMFTKLLYQSLVLTDEDIKSQISIIFNVYSFCELSGFESGIQTLNNAVKEWIKRKVKDKFSSSDLQEFLCFAKKFWEYGGVQRMPEAWETLCKQIAWILLSLPLIYSPMDQQWRKYMQKQITTLGWEILPKVGGSPEKKLAPIPVQRQEFMVHPNDQNKDLHNIWLETDFLYRTFLYGYVPNDSHLHCYDSLPRSHPLRLSCHFGRHFTCCKHSLHLSMAGTNPQKKDSGFLALEGRHLHATPAPVPSSRDRAGFNIDFTRYQHREGRATVARIPPLETEEEEEEIIHDEEEKSEHANLLPELSIRRRVPNTSESDSDDSGREDPPMFKRLCWNKSMFAGQPVKQSDISPKDITAFCCAHARPSDELLRQQIFTYNQQLVLKKQHVQAVMEYLCKHPSICAEVMRTIWL